MLYTYTSVYVIYLYICICYILIHLYTLYTYTSVCGVYLYISIKVVLKNQLCKFLSYPVLLFKSNQIKISFVPNVSDNKYNSFTCYEKEQTESLSLY